MISINATCLKCGKTYNIRESIGQGIDQDYCSLECSGE
ncbi:zinc-ribbon domain protein [Nitrososphaeria virus YSH_1032793]|uniref:Zinc-ribbon domain protein n=1 Tax=Nitrososphaeria virus YSH_1032793 TaxID=3071320 RepID=A0A976UAD4_9CAUD|nr:zinc-ribbon domain protein [Yangshan Harbor Nitrososphaeria virus]UVF62253.1 zinc-ribbon domain protein [Nitrososphaeria virus YSH_1032793]